MESSVATTLAFALVGAAVLIIAGGVGILRILKRQADAKKALENFAKLHNEDMRAINQELRRIGNEIANGNTTALTAISHELAALGVKINNANDTVAKISSELPSWNARSANILESLVVMAEGLDDINTKMEQKMPRARFVELGDAMPAMGVIEPPFTPPAAESLPVVAAAKPKRKPAKKAAKRKPAKKARKTTKKK